MCADWVCPCDPQAVVDQKTLEKYRESVVERSYEVKTARFSVDEKGNIFDYEGPVGSDLRALRNQISTQIRLGAIAGRPECGPYRPCLRRW